MTKERVFFDYNSTTPLDERVLAQMMPFFSSVFGNPSSAHAFGAEAADAVEGARERVATLVNSDANQVTFCGSATEAINTVIGSVESGTIVSSAVEHAATLQSLERAGSRGISTVNVGVDESGSLQLDTLKDVLKNGATLLTLMWANNETGVVFPIEAIAQLCREHDVLFHVDAVQAAGKVEIDFTRLPIDYLSISAHKIFGPKGAAALIAREPSTISPLLVGGGQERGYRAGTENVPAIVGFGFAAELAEREREVRMRASGQLRDQFEQMVLQRCPSAWVNGQSAARVANTANIGFPGIDGDTLVGVLDGMGVAASTGSACHASSMEPSHVIHAMTRSWEKARQSVRFSVSHRNTEDELHFAVNALIAAIEIAL